MTPVSRTGDALGMHKPLMSGGSHLLVVHGELARIAQVHLQGFLLPDGLLVDRLLRLQLLFRRLRTEVGESVPETGLQSGLYLIQDAGDGWVRRVAFRVEGTCAVGQK